MSRERSISSAPDGPTLSALEVVFFDAGHTLLDPHPRVEERYARTAASYGVEAPPGELRERFSRLWSEGRAGREAALYRTDDEGTRRFWKGFVAKVFEPWRGQLTDYEAFFDQLYTEFATRAAWRLFDDVPGALARVRALGLRLAIISNWDQRLPAILDNLGLTPSFEQVVTSAEVGFEKPAPAIFAEALRRLSIAPEQALHVGDSLEDDVVGALGAGLRAAHLRRGERPWSEGREAPYLEVSSLTELAELLERARAR